MGQEMSFDSTLLGAGEALGDYVECSGRRERDNGFTNSSGGNNDAITKMINPGDRINIPCSVGLTPSVSVQWHQNGKPIQLDFSPTQRRHWNITNDGATGLTINRVTKIDEGVWECWALNSQGSVTHKDTVMRLVVTNIPEEPYIEFEGKRLPNHSTLTIRENTVVNVNCVVRGASPPVRHMFWYLQHQNITEESKLLMEYSAEEDISMAISLLTINATQDYHKKVIICQVYHVSWLNPVTASASFDIQFSCVVVFINAYFINTDNVPAFSITRDPGFGYPILEGMPLSLKCDIEANPLSAAKWHRDSEPSHSNASLPQIETQSDGTLYFAHISKADTGWYKCTTEHPFGHFSSFGYYLNVQRGDNPHDPLISETVYKLLSQFEAPELHDLDHILRSPLAPPPLSADGIGGPDGHKDSEPNEAALMKAYEASKESSPYESASNVMQSSAGNQRYGERNSPQPIQQRKECAGNHINTGEPVIDTINRTVRALVGSQIAVSARFCCQPRPKKVYWIHRHLALMPQRTIGPYITRELIMTSDSMNCFTSTFEITSVKPEDSGDILFIVMNPKGVDNAMVSVNVTVASFSVSFVDIVCHEWKDTTLCIINVNDDNIVDVANVNVCAYYGHNDRAQTAQTATANECNRQELTMASDGRVVFVKWDK
ncbi:unnamed protein product [Medioppia subpectinata]|uniref:Ig-like domain-containing protein n=1 Tax=Medioppia subpectinata TaxID=1979941 RepID=A0A7R9KH37_9ACAR|nr:unnamed protein product [Medioppia subpectinata]CAG2103435.1 unnamed protein product [Medioppia subpectinata]